MRAEFGDRCKVLYTDTDSLMYSVECEDVYERMKRDIDRFDTSDYAVDNSYGMPRVNKKVPGLMKDENNGALMTEFVRLRSKMYATRSINATVGSTSETKKVKVCAETRGRERYPIRRLHSLSPQSHGESDSTGQYSIQPARCVFREWGKEHSQFIRRQAVYFSRSGQNPSVGALSNPRARDPRAPRT